jgi:uncharacterized protein
MRRNSRSIEFALPLLVGLAVSAAFPAYAQQIQPRSQLGLDRPPPLPAAPPDEFDPRADEAYGAYQRGYYLSALALALKRAEGGDPAAQTLIAVLYDRGLGITRNGKEAAAWYGLAAAKDYPEAQFAYAVMLIEGKHVEKDLPRARQLLEKAAARGHPTAQFNLAQMIVDEKGRKGFEEALSLYRAAAEAGVPDAQYALAQIFAEGLGTPRDEREARRWLLSAAQRGFDTAQVELGIWLANGRGGTRDETGAFGWIQRAARAGNPIAQNRIAKMFAMGLGTGTDDVEVAKWHILAKRAGLADEWLDRYLEKLDPLVVKAGLERADRWPSG